MTKWTVKCLHQHKVSLVAHASWIALPWVLSQSSDSQFTNLCKALFVVWVQKEFCNSISLSLTEHLIGSDGQFSLALLLINVPLAPRISVLCLPFIILQICWIWQA